MYLIAAGKMEPYPLKSGSGERLYIRGFYEGGHGKSQDQDYPPVVMSEERGIAESRDRFYLFKILYRYFLILLSCLL